MAAAAKPGQFINAKINDSFEPLLRRPFGIHKVNGVKISIMYKVIGKGTRLLSMKKPGEGLDIIGPLGRGFDLSRQAIKGRSAILVAGGMGVAPLLFLAAKLKKLKIKTLVLLGASDRENICCEPDFKNLGCRVKISTDDGSKGFEGYVSALLEKELSAVSRQPLTVYACGPHPMLKEVARICREKNIPAGVSLEEHMSCGFGACLGCAVNTKEGYKRVCKEGPVFDAREIVWD